MLDIKFIRQNPEKIKKAIKDKGYDIDLESLLDLDKKRREILTAIEEKKAKQKKSQDRKEAKEIKENLLAQKEKLAEIEKNYQELLLQIPNLPTPDVKIGKDESENEIIKKVGEIPKFDFPAKDHLSLGEKLEIIDVKRAATVSGSRFAYLKSEGVLLQLALMNFAFDFLIKMGFKPILPPMMINNKSMAGMGYLEHGGQKETYYLEKDNLYLVGTAEQSVGPMHQNELLKEDELPIRYVAYSSCFRREAGSYGQDVKGIFRLHQFDKVEMFSYTKPDQSDKEHEYLLSLEEKLMQMLEIPYQVVKMCTGDLGIPAARKYDIEAYLPGQGRYRETHSTSSCTDFQARRLNIRYKNKKTGENEFVHTLNGTALAMGRTIIAILENYQQNDKSVKIPTILEPYLKGIKVIKPK